MGYDKPNYTQIPNTFFEQMADMTHAELLITLHAMRQTFGYHKTRDAISLTQFQNNTGLSRQGVLNGIEKAIKRKTMQKAGTGKSGTIVYEMVVNDIDRLETKESTQLTSSSQHNRPELVNTIDTQKKKENTINKDNDFQSKATLLREAGLFPVKAKDIDQFKDVDADEYTLDQWQRGIEKTQAQYVKDGSPKGYAYLLTVMESVENEDKQAKSARAIIPVYKPSLPAPVKIVSYAERAAALDILAKAKKGTLDEQ